ncbi:MAG: asparagine synthetase B [Flavobacteriales bacterium]
MVRKALCALRSRLVVAMAVGLFSISIAHSAQLLIPMDDTQSNHLKAYGLAYWLLEQQVEVEWLLNYRGGSFLVPNLVAVQQECVIRGISHQVIADVQASQILTEIAHPESNTERVKLEVAPKIAVYSPDGKQPWDDAVTLVLTYAEIPYDVIYDAEIMSGALPVYDWLHLHHEDFTGQYGKFYRSYRSAAWYQDEVARQEGMARTLGFNKVSVMKRNVALQIRDFVLGGGFLFTMCSGTDSFDIALAAEEVDICQAPFDGDPAEPGAAQKLDYNRGLAFHEYQIITDPMVYEFSDIDATEEHTKTKQLNDFFTLFDFSAKWDIIPTMLTQSHERVIPGFMGQTTAFRKQFIRSDVTIMGETKSTRSAKYIHGTLGQGQWTYYGGHDPEDYRHLVNDPPTDLNLHPNSAGYRLILNNILFPAARKKERKT